jgi:hypothetical protein
MVRVCCFCADVRCGVSCFPAYQEELDRVSKFFDRKLQELMEETSVAREMAAPILKQASAKRRAAAGLEHSPILLPESYVNAASMREAHPVPISTLARRFSSDNAFDDKLDSERKDAVAWANSNHSSNRTMTPASSNYSIREDSSKFMRGNSVMSPGNSESQRNLAAIGRSPSMNYFKVTDKLDIRTEEGFKRMLCDTFRHATLLRDFQMLNHTGFVKITKRMAKYGLHEDVQTRVRLSVGAWMIDVLCCLLVSRGCRAGTVRFQPQRHCVQQARGRADASTGANVCGHIYGR